MGAHLIEELDSVRLYTEYPCIKYFCIFLTNNLLDRYSYFCITGEKTLRDSDMRLSWNMKPGLVTPWPVFFPLNHIILGVCPVSEVEMVFSIKYY